MKKANKIKICAFVILLIASLSNCPAQEPKSSNSASAIRLSLADVSELALLNSLDVQIAKYDAYIKRTSLGEAESIFDTFLNAEVNYLRDKKSQPTSILGTDSKEYGFSLGLEKKLPTGTAIKLDAVGSKNRSNSVFSTLNPYNEASLQASVTQELGKNFFGLADRASIKITKLDIENSDFTSLDNIEEALFDVQRAYWNLIRRTEELDISEETLDNAEMLYEAYKEKYSIGLVEESEFLAIEALLYARRSDLLVSKLNRQTAKNELLFLLNQGRYQQDIITLDDFNFALRKVDLYKALENAIDKRRDYKRINNKIKKNNIELVVSKNALWPQIDLEASFIRNNLSIERSQAWEDAGEGANDEISLVLSLRMPLENRQAKAGLQKVNYQKVQLLLDLKRTERQILLDINNKVNDVNTLEEQVEMYKHTVEIHRKKLAEQVKRLHFGRSNVDTLIDYEQDLLDARRLLAEKLYDYKVALTELDLIKNSLLDQYWQEPL